MEKNRFPITNQKKLRELFWAAYPDLPRKRIKDPAGSGRVYPLDTRLAWHDWKDAMCKDGQISQDLYDRALLG